MQFVLSKQAFKIRATIYATERGSCKKFQLCTCKITKYAYITDDNKNVTTIQR